MLRKLYINTRKASTKLSTINYKEMKVYQAETIPNEATTTFINEKYFNDLIRTVHKSLDMDKKDSDNLLKMKLEEIEREVK